MNALIIEDLEISKELSAKELSAVRGGFNAALVGGQMVATTGISLFSPLTAVNTPVVTQVEVAPVTNVELNLANIIGSAGTALGQFA